MSQFPHKLLRNIAANFMLATTSNHQSMFGPLLKKIMNIHPMTRAVLLYQAGSIKKAKKITDANQYSNVLMRRITKHNNEICLALSDWQQFVKQVGIPEDSDAADPFNGHVLMVVNSVANFDRNGYAIRSKQIRDALFDLSVQVEFSARFGYPWDIRGRDKFPIYDVVSSE